MFRPLVALLLAAAPASLAAQALTPTESTEIDRLVAAALADTGVPSASIAVVRGGQTVLAKAYGRQTEAGGPADPALPYQIASISKQFTAAALLLLEDDGKLSLDDTVAKYVPGTSGGERITLRQLLSHTAGLQDYWPQDYSFPAMARPVTPQGIVDRWAKKPLDFQPGTDWQYSNTGYVVAGLVVEKVAGEPLFAFLQRRVFAPLGIKAYDQDKAFGRGFPTGYGRAALGPNRPVVPAAPGWLFAAGELSMSAADLAKWDIARIERSLMPADDWDEQEKPVLLANGRSTDYGLGVQIGYQNDRRYVEHSGEAVGFVSENIVYPAEKVAVVVLTNSWSGDANTRIARGITRMLLPAPAAAGNDAAVLASVTTLWGQLRAGRPDPALLTDNARSYFTPQVVADFRDSLAPLGEPTGIASSGGGFLRGGFQIRRFRVTYPDAALNLSVFTDPATGRIEQFLAYRAAR